MSQAGLASQGQHLVGAGDIGPPRFGIAVGAAEGEAGRVVEQFVAVARHPVAGVGVEAAERLRQIPFQHDRPGELFAERFLPVDHHRLHAGGGRLFPAATDDDGQAPAIEKQIADEVGAQQPGGAGEKQ